MNAKFTDFIRKNLLLVSLTVLTLVVIFWFGFRLLADFLYFNDPRNVDVDLKGWMTPRFIGITYDLPRELVFEVLELSPESARGQRLRFVAEDLGLTLDELTEKVRAAAKVYRAANP